MCSENTSEDSRAQIRTSVPNGHIRTLLDHNLGKFLQFLKCPIQYPLSGLIASAMYSLTPLDKAVPFRPRNTHGLGGFQTHNHTYIHVSNLILSPFCKIRRIIRTEPDQDKNIIYTKLLYLFRYYFSMSQSQKQLLLLIMHSKNIKH
jgi:hypothetical protein